MPKYEILLSQVLSVRVAIHAESQETAELLVQNGHWNDSDVLHSQCVDTDIVDVELVEEDSPPLTTMNNRRAQSADISLSTFIRETGCDREDSLGDLLCNLMHWARLNNFDFECALIRGAGQFAAELLEEAS